MSSFTERNRVVMRRLSSVHHRSGKEEASLVVKDVDPEILKPVINVIPPKRKHERKALDEVTPTIDEVPGVLRAEIEFEINRVSNHLEHGRATREEVRYLKKVRGLVGNQDIHA